MFYCRFVYNGCFNQFLTADPILSLICSGIANFCGLACVNMKMLGEQCSECKSGIIAKHACLYCVWSGSLCNVIVSCLCHSCWLHLSVILGNVGLI